MVSPRLPIEILIDILAFAQSTSLSDLESQLTTIRFGRVAREWYFASLALTNTFVVNGINHTSELSDRLAKSSLPVPIHRLSITLPTPAPSAGAAFRGQDRLSAPKVLQSLLSHCSQLTSLEVTTGPWLTITALKKYRHGLASLTSLTFNESRKDVLASSREVTCSSLLEALSGLPSLKELRFETCFSQYYPCPNTEWDSTLPSQFDFHLPPVTLLYFDLGDASLLHSLVTAFRSSLTSLDIGSLFINGDGPLLPAVHLAAPNLKHFAIGFPIFVYPVSRWSTPILEILQDMDEVEHLDFSTRLEDQDTNVEEPISFLRECVQIFPKLRRIDLAVERVMDVKRLLKEGCCDRTEESSPLLIAVVIYVDDGNKRFRPGESWGSFKKMLERVRVKVEISTRVRSPLRVP